MRRKLFFGVENLLLDWTPGAQSALRLSFACGRDYINGFWVHLDGKPGVFAHFSFLASVKGQMLFSADEWRLENDPDFSCPGPLLQLRGPLSERGPDWPAGFSTLDVELARARGGAKEILQGQTGVSGFNEIGNGLGNYDKEAGPRWADSLLVPASPLKKLHAQLTEMMLKARARVASMQGAGP